MTKYQKWLSKSGDQKALETYVYRRLKAEVGRKLADLYKPQGVFAGYFTGIWEQIKKDKLGML